MPTYKKTYIQIYSQAKDPDDLHFQPKEIPPIIRRSVELAAKGKALDIGCGTGIYSVFMAQQGFEVTALDYVPQALNFARNRAREAGVDVNFVEADVTTWDNPDRYNLIIDSGCLHNFNREKRDKYRQRLPYWLTDNTSFALIHFGKRSLFDFSRVGFNVKRATKEETERFFLPELELKEFYAGPGKRTLFYYRFARKRPE